MGLPWTRFNDNYCICAYTEKCANLSKMLMARGVEVILYGGPDNTAPCTKYVKVVTAEEQLRWFGPWSIQRLFDNITWNENHECWRTMNRCVIDAMRGCDKHDLIGIIAGTCQKQIADAFPEMIAAEWGIGYRGTFAPFKCFESHAWRHFHYGLQNMENGTYYDTVIHQYVDVDKFPHINGGQGKYLLNISRLVSRKGVEEAALIAKLAGLPLKIAGPGATEVIPGLLKSDEITVFGNHIEYVGAVKPEERSKLMAGARAVLMCTRYLEPGGGVCPQSLTCGTPVIATDFGCFTEQIINNFNGFRFQNIKEAVAAVHRCKDFDNAAIRLHAIRNWSLEATAPKYQRWLSNLLDIYTTNWDGSAVIKA